tara:strand:- start:826 stop:1137 length:312 start_codon:yes stop_codon:yes gene_type:complete
MSHHYGDFGNIKPIASGDKGDSNPKKKLVKVEKKEGEHGPKRIWNPNKPIEMKSGETVSKAQYIRSGDRGFDNLQSAKQLGANALLFGGIFAGAMGLQNIKKP